jgi:hypothetical protein
MSFTSCQSSEPRFKVARTSSNAFWKACSAETFFPLSRISLRSGLASSHRNRMTFERDTPASSDKRSLAMDWKATMGSTEMSDFSAL